MPRPLIPTLALAATALAIAPGAAAAKTSLYTPRACIAASDAPREVIVHYERGTSAAARASARAEANARRTEVAPGATEAVRPTDGESVDETARELEALPEVDNAVPNEIAHASGYFPNDPGQVGTPGGWERLQWNFSGPASVDAPGAWEHAINAGAPGGRGAVVAVLDTGVAYSSRSRFRRAPDFATTSFRRGHDYVDRDRYPSDENGHGTHVAGTVAQSTDNRRGVTGLAYGATLMPMRVLDECGDGDALSIARGIRFAARRGADVINMSFEFDQGVRASQIPDILSAIRYAYDRGVLLVGAAGNNADRTATAVAYPARAPSVFAVGATTENLCRAEYSNSGVGLDIAAPGGGFDAPHDDNAHDASACDSFRGGRQIYQQTFRSSIRTFSLPAGFEGTSMAAPHVAGAAALVIATRRLGADPSPDAVAMRLADTSRDLGPEGFDSRYGAGLLDAAAAVDPAG